MRLLLVFIGVIAFGYAGHTQESDTLNQKDAQGRKQGHWIY